jgi:predicted nucleic acid-binding protein
MYYWDTSTLLKLYVTESDSARFRTLASTTGPVITSDIVRWELYSALQRKEFAKDISPGTAEMFYCQFESDVTTGRVRLLALDGPQLLRFQTLVKKLYQVQPPILVRTLDALHLATALAKATNFVTTDGLQSKSAVALGFTLFN